MPTIPETYKRIRYKVNFFIVDTKLKWYLTSRNPRLIQSKFQGQTLISLRVHPHDKYLVKKGEFLSLEKKQPDYFSWGSLVDLYCQEAVENMSFPPPEEEIQEEPKGCEQPKIQSVDVGNKRISKITRASNFIKSFQRSKPEAGKDTESPGPGLRRRILYSRLFRRRHDNSSNEASPSNKSSDSYPRVWHRILNDVSLSAAQVSTGTAPTSRSDYDNLSSDLTEGRRRVTDVSLR